MKASQWSRIWKRDCRAQDMAKLNPNQDAVYRLLERSLKLSDKPQHIVEVGCGSGIRTLSLLKKHPTYSATLVDYSSQALALAEEIYEISGRKGTAKFVLANILELPFPSNTFDIVWNCGVNEHFVGEERQGIFDKMARICKVKGAVVVMVPNSLNVPYRIHKWWAERNGIYRYVPEIPFTVFELKSRLSQAGLKVTRTGGCSILSSLMLLRHTVPDRIVGKIPVVRNVERTKQPKLLNISLMADQLLSFIGGIVGLTISVTAIKEI